MYMYLNIYISDLILWLFLATGASSGGSWIKHTILFATYKLCHALGTQCVQISVRHSETAFYLFILNTL